MMHGRNAQVARIYRILNILEGAPQGLSAKELRERLKERDFDVSKRTVYRDLEALSDAGFPLFPAEQGGDQMAIRWTLERSARVNQYFALSSREVFALYLARGMLRPLTNTPLHADLEAAFRKIEDKLGQSHRRYFAELAHEIRFEPDRGWAHALDLDVLETVHAACAEGQVLSVDYESANSGTKRRRRLGPHFVYFAKGSPYLIARELADSEIKIFALPRMTNAVLEAETYEAGPLDHKKLFDSSFGTYFGGTAAKVRIRFTRKVASYVKERFWHSSQRLTPRADGAVELAMKVALTPALVQWVLGFGPDAQVLGPEDLRGSVLDSIRRTTELYGEQQSRGE